MKRLLTATVLAIAGWLTIPTQAADALTVTSFTQGWINSSGDGNGVYSGNNTFTGYTSGSYYNSWAAFNIPVGVYGIASLNLTPSTCCASHAENIDIYDVTTLYAALQAANGGVAAYNDLGGGSLYGSSLLLSTPVSVLLSAQALTDINGAAGGIFIVGFHNSSAVAGGSDGIYTNGSGAPQLELSAAVPEPASIALLGLGLTGLAFARRRKAP